MRTYPLAEHVLNTNHIVEFDKIKLIVKMSKYFNRMLRVSIELRNPLLQLTETGRGYFKSLTSYHESASYCFKIRCIIKIRFVFYTHLFSIIYTKNGWNIKTHCDYFIKANFVSCLWTSYHHAQVNSRIQFTFIT